MGLQNPVPAWNCPVCSNCQHFSFNSCLRFLKAKHIFYTSMCLVYVVTVHKSSTSPFWVPGKSLWQSDLHTAPRFPPYSHLHVFALITQKEFSLISEFYSCFQGLFIFSFYQRACLSWNGNSLLETTTPFSQNILLPILYWRYLSIFYKVFFIVGRG